MRVSIFISGGGSFARFAKESPRLRDVNICIIADRSVTRARRHVDRHLIKNNNSSYWQEFDQVCSNSDLIFLNFNHIVPTEICARHFGKIINQHPALLPSFKGLHVFQDITDSGVCFSGSTFHFVTPEVDCGPIICQTIFSIAPSDTAVTISRKNYFASRDAYVQVIRWFADKRVVIGDNRVFVRNATYRRLSTVPNLERGDGPS